MVITSRALLVNMAAGHGRGVVQSFECFSTLIDRHEGLAASFTEQDEYRKAWTGAKFNGSRPLDLKLFHSLSHKKSTLKSHVRAGVSPDIRRNYWLACLQVSDEDVVVYSKALKDQDTSSSSDSSHFLSQVLSGVPSYSQKPEFANALIRVLSYTRHEPYSSCDCPLLPVIAHVLLHMLEEWECFVGLRNLLTRQMWVNRSQVESVASLLTLIKLMSTHLRSTDIFPLKPVGMGENFFLMEVFSDWYLWPFINKNFWVTVRVMDLYLLDGPKALYRLALSAVRMYHKSNMFNTARTDEWPPSQLISHFLSTLSLEQTCDWIHQSFSLPRLPTDNLLKLWLQNCSAAEKMSANRIPSPSLLQTSVESESVANDNRKKRLTRELKVDPVSEILELEDCKSINGWLPDWIQGNLLNCLFQASKHGYNLRTLYRRCENTDPLLLVIKTAENSTFGALLVGDLKDRWNNTFFGSGETILFSLRPDPKCYSWTAESDLILRANDDELIVGSGGGQFGLWIDGDLDRGSTATCTSYANPPLTGDGKIDFKCSAMEVFRVDWDE